MAFLAEQSGKSVETAKVAEETDVPPVYLRKIFQSLARSGLVRTTAGSGGGVCLTSKPADVTLKDIIEAVEGPISLSDCIEHSSVCPRSARCKTNRCLSGIQTRIQQEFSSHTLADLM